jgi:3-oxoacyl-[acyl-carrier protein] reductase
MRTSTVNPVRCSIGRSCALKLASCGVNLALTYSASKHKIDALVTGLKETRKELRISTHKVDMASAEDITTLFIEIQAHHSAPVDILVSNAGHGKRIVDVL